jgi:flagellar assembly protein FliH
MNSGLLKTVARRLHGSATLVSHPRAQPATPAVAPAPSPPDAAAAEERRVAAELESLRRAAHEEGLRQGRQEALRQSELSAARQEAAMHGLARSIDEAVRAQLADLEQFALAVAFEACGTVLSQASLDGRAVADTVRRLIEPLRQSGAIRVQLHPEDLSQVSPSLLGDPRLAAHPPRFEADATLERGDCRVVTAHGQLESGLSIQLTAIRDSLIATHLQIASLKGSAP